MGEAVVIRVVNELHGSVEAQQLHPGLCEDLYEALRAGWAAILEAVLCDLLIRYERDIQVLRVVSDPSCGVGTEVFLEYIAQSLLRLRIELGVDRVGLPELERLVGSHDRGDDVVGSRYFFARAGLHAFSVDVRLSIAHSRAVGVPDVLSVVSRRLDPLDRHGPEDDDVSGECATLLTDAVAVVGVGLLVEGGVVATTHGVGDPLIPCVDEVVLDAEARGGHTIGATESGLGEVDLTVELQGIRAESESAVLHVLLAVIADGRRQQDTLRLEGNDTAGDEDALSVLHAVVAQGNPARSVGDWKVYFVSDATSSDSLTRLRDVSRSSLGEAHLQVLGLGVEVIAPSDDEHRE